MKNLNRQLGIQVTPIPAYMGGGFLNATGEESALKKKIATDKNEIRSLEKKKADENVKLENEKKKRKNRYLQQKQGEAMPKLRKLALGEAMRGERADAVSVQNNHLL